MKKYYSTIGLSFFLLILASCSGGKQAGVTLEGEEKLAPPPIEEIQEVTETEIVAQTVPLDGPDQVTPGDPQIFKASFNLANARFPVEILLNSDSGGTFQIVNTNAAEETLVSKAASVSEVFKIREFIENLFLEIEFLPDAVEEIREVRLSVQVKEAGGKTIGEAAKKVVLLPLAKKGAPAPSLAFQKKEKPPLDEEPFLDFKECKLPDSIPTGPDDGFSFPLGDAIRLATGEELARIFGGNPEDHQTNNAEVKIISGSSLLNGASVEFETPHPIRDVVLVCTEKGEPTASTSANLSDVPTASTPVFGKPGEVGSMTLEAINAQTVKATLSLLPDAGSFENCFFFAHQNFLGAGGAPVFSSILIDLVALASGVATAECPAALCEVEGVFQPSQGVWQDDDTFEEKLGNFLKEISPASHRADLDMVSGRDTLLFGVRKDNYDKITIKGKTFGTLGVPVAVQFTLFNGKGKGKKKVKVIHTTEPEHEVFLGGACGTAKGFEITIDSKDGIPPPGEKPFPFDGVFSRQYTIEAELIRGDGEPTGIKIDVTGDVVDTRVPRIHFVPVITGSDPLDLATGTSPADLKEKSDLLADFSERLIPDWYPVHPVAVVALPGELLDMTERLKRSDLELKEFFKEKGYEVAPEKLNEDLRKERQRNLEADIQTMLINDELQSSSSLSGAGRVVALFRSQDFEKVAQETAARGEAVSNKVVFVREGDIKAPPKIPGGARSLDLNLIEDAVETIAHELIHTLNLTPEGAKYFAESAMIAKCGKSYHNFDDLRGPHANGHRIRRAGDEFRERFQKDTSLMGTPGEKSKPSKWINQCTYVHLLEQLQLKHDPKLILIRGFVGNDGKTIVGKLFPAYQILGEQDLEPAFRGEFAIVLSDSGGRELGRFPFSPNFVTPETARSRFLASFSHRVPDLPQTARISLFGPSGLLESRDYSANPPKVTILSPQKDTPVGVIDGKVLVRWEGSDLDQDKLLYSLLYSSDGGETFLTILFESEVIEAKISVDPKGREHVVKVIVTDGTRSAEDLVSFTLIPPS